MRPTGLAATVRDEERDTVTNDYRGFKCDNRGFPEGGQPNVGRVDEPVVTRESTTADKEQGQ